MRIVLGSGRSIDSVLDYLPSADAFDIAKRTPGGGAVITTESRIHAPLGSYNIGQNNFTLRVVFRVPMSGTYASTPHVFSLAPTNVGFSAQTLTGFIWSDGKFMLRLYGSTTSDYRSKGMYAFVPLYGGKVVELTIVREGADLRMYVNGVDVELNDEATGGTPPADWSGSINSTYLQLGYQFNSEFYAATVFNYALSAQQVFSLCLAGIVDDSDRWGNPTNRIQTQNWVNNDLSFFSPSSGTFAMTSTAGGQYAYLTYLSFGSLAANRRYEMEFTASGASGASFLAGVQGQSNFVSAIANGVNKGTVLTTASSTPNLIFAGTGSGSVTVSGIILRQIGAVLDQDLAVGLGFQVTDRSFNKLHGYATAGSTHLVPKRFGQLRGRTDTNGNQWLLGATALPTGARINSLLVNVGGAMTPLDFGTSSGGAQIGTISNLTAAGRYELTSFTTRLSVNSIWVKSGSTATVDTTVNYELVD